MTREELIKVGASKVRKNPALYALYKKYVTEDAKEMYASGKLPQGCFGCQFNSIFTRWKNHVSLETQDTKIKKTMAVYNAKKVSKGQKTKTSGKSEGSYELKNRTKKLFFKGQVLSHASPSEDWLDFINYPKDPAQVKARKELFNVLPAGTSTAKPKAPKKVEDTAPDKPVDDEAKLDAELEAEIKAEEEAKEQTKTDENKK